jgi:hypothetical protein
MILGMSLATFTLVHVILSLIGIAIGLVVLAGMLRSQLLPGWTAVFLVTTILTSVTGFFFPFEKLLPSHIFGIISLVVLAVTLYALYARRLAGAARWLYVSTALFALYLNVFVLVVQVFVKIPFFKALAPTQAEPPFAIAQGIVLLAFFYLGYRAVRSFHPGRAGALRPA